MPLDRSPTHPSRMTLLRRKGQEAWDGFMDTLTEAQRRRLLWSSAWVLRPDQMLSQARGFRTLMLRSGRGSGKSFSAVHAIKDWAEAGRKNILLVGRTHNEVMNNLIKDKFAEVMPTWLYDAKTCLVKSEKEIVLKNPQKTTVRYYSADAEDSLRGPSPDGCVLDEFAHFEKPQDIMNQVNFMLRGKRRPHDNLPMLMVTSTPLKIEAMEKLEGLDSTFCRQVPTDANREYLDADYIRNIEDSVDHELYLLQERYGEYVNMDGVMMFHADSWQDYHLPKYLADGRTVNQQFRDSLSEVVVSVDPSGALDDSPKSQGSDLTGVHVAGRVSGTFGARSEYVCIGDWTRRMGIEAMVNLSADLAEKWGATKILVESNGVQNALAGSSFFQAIGRRGPWRVVPVNARIKKHERMAPVSGMFSRRRVWLARTWNESRTKSDMDALTRELGYFSFGGLSCTHSPDRSDAMSQALNYLNGNTRPLIGGDVAMTREDADMLEEFNEAYDFEEDWG